MPSNSSSGITGSMDADTVASMMKGSQVIGTGHIRNFFIMLFTYTGKDKCFGLTQFVFFITKSKIWILD